MYYLCEPVDCSLFPNSLAKRYRMADGPAIKVALFLLLGGSGDEESIADALSMPLAVVERALSFWQKAELITDTPPVLTPTKVPSGTTPLPARVRNPLTPSQMSEMSLRDPNVKILMQEAQNFLGRPLYGTEAQRLLQIMEYDELPVDAILLILAFCTPRAKNLDSAIRLAERTAMRWREDGICTVAETEERIRKMELREQRERDVAEILETVSASFTAAQRGYIAAWFEDYGFDIGMVEEAFLRAPHEGEKNRSVNYLNGILKEWNRKAFRTRKDLVLLSSNAQSPGRKKQKGSDDSLLLRALHQRKERVKNGTQ